MDFVDKIFIGLIGMILFIIEGTDVFHILPLLIAIFTVCLNIYLSPQKSRYIFYIVYILLSFIDATFLFFLPVVSYDFFLEEDHHLGYISLIPLLIHLKPSTMHSCLLSFLLLCICWLLRKRTSSLIKIRLQHLQFQDEAREYSLLLSQKNKELMDKQDYEVHVATLNERNRIAREIHDHVGHMLSRCLLQVGALLAINKDATIKENLELIKDTLSDSMTSIRESVHNLHDESLDLQTEVQKLVNNFTFCSIHLDYDTSSNIPRNLKYCFIAILKESLSNIVKHSNATFVRIIVCEHPAFYQLIIEDNGKASNTLTLKNGMGLTNISDRVSQLNGQLNIEHINGFNIFISIPKEVLK